MKRIAIKPEEVSPSLSLGTSLDHVVTIFLPILGGLAWSSSGPGGYRYVFFGGAVIALIRGNAILFLRQASSLTYSPLLPDIYLDEDYRQEISRRMEIKTGKPLSAAWGRNLPITAVASVRWGRK